MNARAGKTTAEATSLAAGVPLRCGILLLSAVCIAPGQSAGDILGFGANSGGQLNVPALPAGLAYTQVAAGSLHSAAIRSDGMLLAWGANGSGQIVVPPPPPGLAYIQAAGGERHTVALLNDGSIVALGNNSSGQINVPPPPAGVSYVQIAAGGDNSAALRNDGQIAVWGSNASGQLAVPALPPGVVYTQVDVGGLFSCPALGTTCAALAHVVAVRSDGTAVAWGNNSNGQATVPPSPSGTFVVQAAAGSLHSLFLLSDGTIIGSGSNASGQVSGTPPLPPGATHVQIAAGSNHSLALRSDGTAAAWGLASSGQANIATPPQGLVYTDIAGGSAHSLALLGSTAQASVTAVGSGCGGAQGIPVLSSTQVPFIGNFTFALDVSGAMPNSAAYLFFATATAPAPLPLGGGCLLQLEWASFSAFLALGLSPFGPLPTGPSGATSFSLPVPADPQAAGLSLAFQAAIADGTTSLGLSLTNGLVCVIN